MFRSFDHTAFRLEVRETYNARREVESFRRFKAGEPVDLSWADTWFNMIRQATAEGRRFARVRIVSLPLSDYSRFALWAARLNSAAGEDIRYLPREEVKQVDLPNHDYWLFDSCKLVRMHFDEQDRFQGGEIIADVTEIVKHNYWRDVAQHHAIRQDSFEAKVQ
ncbi:DUF6879 family protein [Actinophytocola sediminis]